MRGSEHPPEVKAQVMAALLAGQGVTEVANQYNLAKSVVSRIKSQLGDKLEQVGTEKTRDFGEMLGKYLEELLNTATVQQVHFRDKEWLNRQPADSLAVLHGVCIDKGIRLFEAARAASQE